MKTPYIIRLANAICILFLLVICYPQITIAQRSGHVIGGGYRHPLGYFAVTLSTDAILLSVGNQQYYYDSGV